MAPRKLPRGARILDVAPLAHADRVAETCLTSRSSLLGKTINELLAPLQTAVVVKNVKNDKGIIRRLAKLHSFGSEFAPRCSKGICDLFFPVVNFRNITAIVRRARYRGANHSNRYQEPKFLGMAVKAKGTTCSNAKTRASSGIAERHGRCSQRRESPLLHFRMKYQYRVYRCHVSLDKR